MINLQEYIALLFKQTTMSYLAITSMNGTSFFFVIIEYWHKLRNTCGNKEFLQQFNTTIGAGDLVEPAAESGWA